MLNKNFRGFNTITNVQLDRNILENDLHTGFNKTTRIATLGYHWLSLHSKVLYQENIKVVSTATEPIFVSNGNVSIIESGFHVTTTGNLAINNSVSLTPFQPTRRLCSIHWMQKYHSTMTQQILTSSTTVWVWIWPMSARRLQKASAPALGHSIPLLPQSATWRWRTCHLHCNTPELTLAFDMMKSQSNWTVIKN